MSVTRKLNLNVESLGYVHIVGVCGTLMGAFAAYLKRRGLQVTGSDQNIYPPMSDVLRMAGVVLYHEYRAENLTASGRKPDLVVIGNVISSTNPEARAAIDGGYVYCSLPEAMESLFLEKTRNLVVAGTHGKTTTASLLSHVLSNCHQDPCYFIGGVSKDLPFSFHLSTIEPRRLFVLEGDEYDTAFWDKVPKFNHYLPNDVILTSVEYDHADIYPDMNAVIKAFQGLVQRIRPGGRIIACYDYPVIKELVSNLITPPTGASMSSKSSESHQVASSISVISYARDAASKARYMPGKMRVEGELTKFEVLDQGQVVDEVSIQLSGTYNVMNALAVWIECRELDIPSDQIKAALQSFRGVKRRQEVRGEVKGITVIDDFAHHPTAVRETLKGLRLKYPNRRVTAVFEPRSATSRRKVFQDQYGEAFQEADVIFIAQPFDQSKISATDRFSSDTLVEDLARRGKQAHLFQNVDAGVADVAKHARSGDLIAVLSNGGFEGFIEKLLRLLKE